MDDENLSINHLSLAAVLELVVKSTRIRTRKKKLISSPHTIFQFFLSHLTDTLFRCAHTKDADGVQTVLLQVLGASDNDRRNLLNMRLYAWQSGWIQQSALIVAAAFSA